MPALPAVAKVVRIDHHFSESTDSNIQIREFFQYSGALSPGDAITWCHLFATAMGTFVVGAMANQLSLVMTQLTDQTTTSAPQVQDTTGAVGTAGTIPNATGVAMVIKKHINRRYRGGHPRVYIPGTRAAGLTTSGQWDPTYANNFLAAYNTYIGTVIGGGVPAAIGVVQHVSISFFSGFHNVTGPSGRVHPEALPRSVPLVDLIQSYSVNLKPGSQRRRNEQ